MTGARSNWSLYLAAGSARLAATLEGRRLPVGGGRGAGAPEPLDEQPLVVRAARASNLFDASCASGSGYEQLLLTAWCSVSGRCRADGRRPLAAGPSEEPRVRVCVTV